MEQKPLFPINYLGKTYSTTIHRDLTDAEYEGIVAGIRAKPGIHEVEAQLKAVHAGGARTDKVYSYYFKDVAYKTRLIYNNWSIDEALAHKPLMEFFAGKVADNKKVYPDTMPLWKKVETAFRLCGFRTCSKPSNFPIKAIDGLLERYCPRGGNYYDFSCGWGTRLLSSLRNGVNYFGTDPNTELVPRLYEMASDYLRVNGGGPDVAILRLGSERLQPAWEGEMDLAFSSPPYFSLEDYRIGDQSYKEGTDYDDWLENYAVPTVRNCFRYVRPGGFFGYNVKNNFKYMDCDLERDWLDAALDAGFEELEELPLANITRVSGHRHGDGANTMAVHDNDEVIRMFRRPANG